MRRLGLAFVTGMWLVACDDGGATGSGGSAGSTTTSTDSTSSSGGGGSGGVATGGGGSGGVATGGGGSGGSATGGGGAGGGTSTGGGGPTGACGRKCAQDADCCPAGVANCPGPYPVNYSCADPGGGGQKTCLGPQCASNAECEGTGLLGYLCKPVFDTFQSCVEPCQVDADCSAPTKCIGMAGDGTAYCTIQSPPFMCAQGDGQCTGYGECAESGDKCVCSSDDDCSDANYLKDCVVPN